MMRAILKLALFLAAAALSPAWAETVYKCQVGDKTLYSQEPCVAASAAAKAKTLEINDARTVEQREQARAATKAQVETAEALESKRLASEAKFARQLAAEQQAAANAARNSKVPQPVVVQPIVVVRPVTGAGTNTAQTTPPKPYCHLSALRCN